MMWLSGFAAFAGVAYIAVILVTGIDIKENHGEIQTNAKVYIPAALLLVSSVLLFIVAHLLK